MMHWRTYLAAAAAVALAAAPARAQLPTDTDASRLYATRAQLEAMLAKFEQGARIEGYSDQVRQVVQDEAELIRTRLKEGDIQVGDQIELTVTGMQSLTGTFTVLDGRQMILPDLGAVPLAGLLRSELQEGIRDWLSKYVVDPQVFVRSKIRLSVWGEVGSPGYIVVPADNLLTEVLATAGQPRSTANQDEIHIKRNGDVIWEGDPLQRAIVEGRTIDQMNLRAGDRIEVPAVKTRSGLLGNTGVLRNLYYLVPLTLALIRLFN